MSPCIVCGCGKGTKIYNHNNNNTHTNVHTITRGLEHTSLAWKSHRHAGLFGAELSRCALLYVESPVHDPITLHLMTAVAHTNIVVARW